MTVAVAVVVSAVPVVMVGHPVVTVEVSVGITQVVTQPAHEVVT